MLRLFIIMFVYLLFIVLLIRRLCFDAGVCFSFVVYGLFSVFVSVGC